MTANSSIPSTATFPERLRALPAAVWQRSLRASVVVGTILTALNHGDAILQGHYSAAWWWKIPLTYVVPFVVATYGAFGRSA